MSDTEEKILNLEHLLIAALRSIQVGPSLIRMLQNTEIVGTLTVDGGIIGPGFGDMLKTVYDSDMDGVIDTAAYAASAGSANALPWSVIAGDGLTGGGLLNASQTLNIGAGAGIAVGVDTVAVDTNYAFTWASAHTFNAGATIAAGQNLQFGADVALNRKTTDVLQLATGDALQSATFTSGGQGWAINASGSAEFANVRIRGEIAAAVFRYSEVVATAGSAGVFKSAAILYADVTPPASGSFTIPAKNNDAGTALFASGDILWLKAPNGAGILSTYATVTAVSNQGTYTNYTVTFNSGSSGTAYRAGAVVVDLGPAGTGFITQSADGTFGTSANLSIWTHAGSPWSATTLQGRFGNLNGSYGVAAGTNTYGIGIGDYAGNKYLVFTPGALTVRGTINADAGYLGALTVSGLLSLNTTGELRAGADANNGIRFGYISTGYFIRGMAAGVTQFELRASDGRAYAGGGTVIIGSRGLGLTTSVQSGGDPNANYMAWYASTAAYASGTMTASVGYYIDGFRVDSGTGLLKMVANGAAMVLNDDGSGRLYVPGPIYEAGWVRVYSPNNIPDWSAIPNRPNYTNVTAYTPTNVGPIPNLTNLSANYGVFGPMVCVRVTFQLTASTTLNTGNGFSPPLAITYSGFTTWMNISSGVGYGTGNAVGSGNMMAPGATLPAGWYVMTAFYMR
jgi:hypothetical protein